MKANTMNSDQTAPLGSNINYQGTSSDKQADNNGRKWQEKG